MVSPIGKVVPIDEIGEEARSVRITDEVPLIEYIEKQHREYVSTQGPIDKRSPSIILRRTRGLKWIISGEYGGAWVFRVDDETDFRKLATAMYIFSKIRRSKFWAWWYRSVRKIDISFASEGVTSAEWK